jgi:hypothetical protein
MSRISYIRTTSGATVYGKPSPVQVTPWADDVVVFSEIGTTGLYAGTISDAHHEIYLQAGGSPAATDTPFAYEPDSLVLSAILEDTGTTIPATLASITSAFSAGATIQSPVPEATRIELIAGDTYDGSSAPKLPWTVDKDYSGNTITLILSNSDGSTIYGRYTGAVESSTLVTVTMDAVFDTEPTYVPCTNTVAIANIQFALVSIDGDGDEETIARGTCKVYKRGATA